MTLQTVGIKNVNLPVKVRQKTGGHQETVAAITLEAELGRRHRQRCVTEFITILNQYQNDLGATRLPSLLRETRRRLDAAAARITLTFPYFLNKRAPVTGTAGLMEYTCRFTASSNEQGEEIMLSVWVPTTTLCPCSKEISEQGAHNQRAEINLNVRYRNFIWLEDLITLVEGCASCELFSLLKRPDEKYVTEQAYANPMFVEDVARSIAEAEGAHPDILWFSVGVESFESIHKHSAYAFIDSAQL